MKINIGKFPKNGKGQKIDIHLDRWDTWNVDSTLAKIIYPMLLQLKENKMGIPGEFVDNVGGEDYADQQSFDFYKETHGDAWNEACKRWDDVLDKMIWSFGQLAFEEYDSQYHHGKAEFDWVETPDTHLNPITGKNEKMWQMVDRNPDEHWYDHVGHRLHEARMQEGFELFGKYFRNLWD